MALTIAQAFREHRRFTGDGLTNEPVGAPLPIGDPQSGPHSPTKAEIREALGPLETAVTDVQDLIAEAEAIRDVVAGYASDAVSQGFVPIYSSAAAVSDLDIDASITGLRTNGFSTYGDGGGAFYVRDDAPSAGSIVDDNGDDWRLASWPLNVKMFGATGDGTTDDSEALQTAFSAAGGQHLYIPPGVYKCVTDTTLTLASGVTLVGYGATLDFSSAAEASHVRITGSLGSPVTLTANAAESTNAITLASVAGLAEGDILRISSDALVRLDAIGGSTTQQIGEFVVVRGIASLVVTIDGYLDDTYNTADNAVIEKLVPHKNNSILGLTIIGLGEGGDTDDRGINALFCENLTIKDCHIIDCERMGIQVEQTYKFLIDNNDIRSAFDAADTFPASLIRYGICPVGCTARGTISNNHITGGKHGIVWSENSRPGVGRDVTVTGNTILGTGHCAIATHETNERFTIHANRMLGCAGGIDCRVRNGVITSNEVRNLYTSSSVANGILLRENAGDLLISDNRFIGCRYGVRGTEDVFPELARPVDIIIRGNHFEDISQHGIEVIQCQNGLGMTGWVIESNSFRNCAGSTIKLVGEFVRPVIANNTILCDSDPTGYGVFLGGTDRPLVTGNRFLGLVPVRMEEDTQTSPAVTRKPALVRNIWDHTTAFYSTTTATQIQLVGNTEIGDIQVTIASGVITVPSGAPYIIVDTQSSAATDDLDTINGGNPGDIVTFRGASSARDVTFKDGTGNLSLEGDCAFTSVDDTITLVNVGSAWRELARSNNA